MAIKKIFLGTDHAGYKLKEYLKEFLKKEGYKVEDCGALTYDKEDDYPEFIHKAASRVAEDPINHRGIVMGGSGQGEALVANKVKGIRAALYYGGDTDIVTLSRTHNDSNVLSIGARFLSEEEAKKVVKLWLNTPFSDEKRHKRRITQISFLEK